MPHFIAAGNHHFPRNPNGFYPFWPSFSPPFSSPSLTFPILMKSLFAQDQSFFEAQGPFLSQLSQWETSIPSHLFYCFLLFFPWPSLMGKGVGIYIYAGSKGVPLFGILHANTPWFLECFGFETCSPMCWNLPAALFNELADLLYVASIFPTKG